MNRTTLLLLALSMLAACGTDTDSTQVADQGNKTSDVSTMTAKPQGPVSIDYRIIGTPILGQPLAIDLEVTSTVGPQAVTLSYRVNDSTAMEFMESQPSETTIAPSSDEGPSLQQVRLVPLREGRLFLNVSASVEIDGGTVSTSMAIPIEVGTAERQIEENGVITSDENGNPIHALPASEN
jgi:hypothetical protein